MRDTRSGIEREKRIREIAEAVYADNRKKGMAEDPMRDWKQAEQIYDDKTVYYGWWLPSRFINRYYYKIIAFAVTMIVFLFAWNVKSGLDFKEVDVRPYVTIKIIDPIQISDNGTNSVYFGNYMILDNNGKTPAANVTAKYILTTELDKQKQSGQKWIDERQEGIGSLGFISPGGMIKEPGFKSLSPVAKYYYFEAIVSYQGLSSSKRYWTRVRKVFRMDKTSGRFIEVLSESEWDNNRVFSVPQISGDGQIRNLLSAMGNK
ncbi:MAG: hypothetical protein WC512_01295 [Candidatus Omnitrophota bacterium]|jgi:hypothetical protein